ncbi:MAG: hypothetical protein NT094_00480 [Candidatus Staskawiczbacteria bacterium]|nr:hypothetical protein [Candidatus Staskawiczbacteria bacterium]
MSKITEKQLIEQIKTLKEIQPRKEWAVLLKSQILTEKPAFAESFVETKQIGIKVVEQPAKSVGIMDILSFIFSQKKLAYSFAVILFLIVGTFGFMGYTMPGDLLFPVKKIAEQSQASLTGQTSINQDVAKLNSRINDLSQVAKKGRMDNIPSAISEININAKALAKNLKSDLVKNPQTIKEIAVSLKTLANIPGADLSETPNVKDLYQIVVESQIADLQKTTLTDDQKKVLIDIEELYKQGKYSEALEKILLINK